MLRLLSPLFNSFLIYEGTGTILFLPDLFLLPDSLMYDKSLLIKFNNYEKTFVKREKRMNHFLQYLKVFSFKNLT